MQINLKWFLKNSFCPPSVFVFRRRDPRSRWQSKSNEEKTLLTISKSFFKQTVQKNQLRLEKNGGGNENEPFLTVRYVIFKMIHVKKKETTPPFKVSINPRPYLWSYFSLFLSVSLAKMSADVDIRRRQRYDDDAE